MCRSCDRFIRNIKKGRKNREVFTYNVLGREINDYIASQLVRCWVRMRSVSNSDNVSSINIDWLYYIKRTMYSLQTTYSGTPFGLGCFRYFISGFRVIKNLSKINTLRHSNSFYVYWCQTSISPLILVHKLTFIHSLT